jgi:dethiobiotin synthetase
VRGIFITGTDTGVGKTFVACGLVLLLREMGIKVGVMKPFESGCVPESSGLVPSDAIHLARAAASGDSLELICPYRFASPVAPLAAAGREKIAIDISRVLEAFRVISDKHDLTLVEGAGGLLVPLMNGITNADLAKEFGTPLIIVAANRLGAINHTLLTIEVALARGIPLLGYILNQIDPESTPAAETNGESLKALTACPLLGEIPFVPTGEPLLPLFREKIWTERLALPGPKK